MIILTEHQKANIKAVVFDFDGTLSTLRCGWEKVMEPMMIEYIGNGKPDDALRACVREYIDRSTGIQTISQMKWLVQKIRAYGNAPGASDDPWFYKAEYNRRLMENIKCRRIDAANGNRQKYLIDGSEQFLAGLTGCSLNAASGTDEADVIEEATVLGVAKYFARICGAKPMSEACSKEATLRKLITESGYAAENILVVGDGPVEIRLGREYGALTLGVASNEAAGHGLNAKKLERLTNAGAHAVIDCFTRRDEILEWMNS